MLLLQPKAREYSNPTPNYSELVHAADNGMGMAAGQGMGSQQGAPPPPMQFNPQGQQFPGQMAFMQMPANGGMGAGMMMMGPNGMMYPVAVGQAAPMMYGAPQQSMLPQQQQYQQGYQPMQQQQQPQQQMQPAGNTSQQQHYGPGAKAPSKAAGGRKPGSTAPPQHLQPAATPGSAPYGAIPVQQQPQAQQPYNMVSTTTCIYCVLLLI